MLSLDADIFEVMGFIDKEGIYFEIIKKDSIRGVFLLLLPQLLKPVPYPCGASVENRISLVVYHIAHCKRNAFKRVCQFSFAFLPGKRYQRKARIAHDNGVIVIIHDISQHTLAAVRREAFRFYNEYGSIGVQGQKLAAPLVENIIRYDYEIAL